MSDFKSAFIDVLPRFFFVGAQVGVSSFFIGPANYTAGLTGQSAAFWLSVALLAFIVRRFAGTFLMKFIAMHRQLFFYSLANILLLLAAVGLLGTPAVYCLDGVEFFISAMILTIFALRIPGMGSRTKIGSSPVMMAKAGGAFFPVISGRVSEQKAIRQTGWVPLFCFFVILFFSLRTTAKQHLQPSMAHG